MSGHTPGPWSASLVRVQRQIITQHGAPIAYTHGERIDEETDAANARLIAAAPDLLALLIELVDMEGPQPGTSAWGDKVLAAIAKAKGGAA